MLLDSRVLQNLQEGALAGADVALDAERQLGLQAQAPGGGRGGGLALAIALSVCDLLLRLVWACCPPPKRVRVVVRGPVVVQVLDDHRHMPAVLDANDVLQDS